jgi:hypothetical protein
VFTSQSVFVFAIVNEFGLLWKKGSLYGDLLSQAMQEKHRYEMLSKSILDTMTPWEIVRTAIEPNYKIIDAIKPTPEEMETKEKLIKYALYQNLLETN